MQTNAVLTDAYERVQGIVKSVLKGVSEPDLAYRPGPDANSIAWLVWHLARGQDAQIADVAGHEQVWTTDGWADRFGLPFAAPATGYGMSSGDVAKVRADAKLLQGYYDAVHVRTLEFLQGLTEADYEKVVDTNWDPPVTLAARLVSILADDLQHAGQATYVRGLLKS